MSILKTKRSALAALKNQTEALWADLEAKGEKASGEERAKLNAMLADGEKMAAEIKAFEAMEQGGSEPLPSQIPAASPAPYKGLGQRFIESKEFKGRGSNPEIRSTVEVKADEIVGVSGVASTQAFPVFSQRLAEIFAKPVIGFEVLNAIAKGTTNSNSIDYLRQNTRTINAAETQELSSKPQSVLDWELVTATVRTIPHYVVATEQVLDDEPRLRGEIDDNLVSGLYERLQTQVLLGAGTGVNLEGLTVVSGTNSRVHATSGSRYSSSDTKGDTIRRMLTDVRLAYGNPNLVILNPGDAEEIELEREGAGTGQYLRTYDVAAGRIWRVPVIENAAITAGTALAGDFARGAKLYMRQDVTVSTGWVNDQFIKNAFTLRAEMRAAFAIPYPAFFSKATGM